MPDHLVEVLIWLGRSRMTAGQLQGQIRGVTPSAISNRLAHLLSLGFVTRERNGKFWVYSAAKKGGAKL